MIEQTRLAEDARKAEKYSLAVRLYRESLAATPDDPSLLAGMAYCLYQLGKKQDATTTCKTALAANSSLALAHVVLAYVYQDDSEISESRRESTTALALDPDSAEVLYCNGILREIDGNFDGAIQYLERAAEINPEMYLAHYNLLYCYERKSNRKRIEQEIRVLFRLRPTFWNFIRLLSMTFSTNRVLLAAFMLVPFLMVFVHNKLLVIPHLFLVALYLASAILAFLIRQPKMVWRNVGMAVFLAITDVILLSVTT